MRQEILRRAALLLGSFLGVWLFARYLLPVCLPFALGLLLALTAEPAVRVCTGKFRLPRWAAAGLGVTVTLLLLLLLVGALGAVAVKELGVLAGKLPQLQAAAQTTTAQLRDLLEQAAHRAPPEVRPLVDRSVSRLFSAGSEFVEQATVRFPGTLSSILSKVPNGALTVGTAILSAFMLSARLPKLKTETSLHLPDRWRTRLLPALNQSKSALLGWLKAQLKLSAITYAIVTLGLLLLQIPLAPLWAAGVALVDAVPLLGTGAVLLPWALVCLIQREHLRSIGLLCIYGAAFLSRTILEPRLVGRHLGLDPLVTLIFLYIGYRFWGLPGMLLAPMLVAAITADMKLPDREE